MTSGDGTPAPAPGEPEALAALLAENERLRRDLGALENEVVDAIRQITTLNTRRRDVQARTLEAAASLAAIRASNSWRMLEAVRRLRRRMRAVTTRTVRRLDRRARPAGVCAAVRRAPLGVNVAGYIGAESGLGEAVRRSIGALERAGIPAVLNDVRGVQRAGDRTYTSFSEENPHPFNLVHLNADNMADFEQQRGPKYFRDRYTIGFWFWELSRFRHEWTAAFRVVDEVWAATRFARDAIRSASSVPVVRMPLPVSAPTPGPFGRDHFGLPERRFVFLFTFDVSSQMERKNPLAVVRAYRRAALPRDGSMLVLKFTNGHFDREAVGRLAEAAEGTDLLMLDGCMDRLELNALTSACDCYVSLHRAEGFGLTMAEAMALGKPVIATGYSGNMDFMTADTAALVGYRLEPLKRDYGPYPRGFEWAEADEDGAARLMRRMVEAPHWARELGRRASEGVAAVLGPEVAAERYRRRLDALHRGSCAVGDEDE